MQRDKVPLPLGFACNGMQIAISSSSYCQRILEHMLVGSMALDNMVLAHSNVVLVGGMDHSKDCDRSSSLPKRATYLP